LGGPKRRRGGFHHQASRCAFHHKKNCTISPELLSPTKVASLFWRRSGCVLRSPLVNFNPQHSLLCRSVFELSSSDNGPGLESAMLVSSESQYSRSLSSDRYTCKGTYFGLKNDLRRCLFIIALWSPSLVVAGLLSFFRFSCCLIR
jgi:hypothetical protein